MGTRHVNVFERVMKTTAAAEPFVGIGRLGSAASTCVPSPGEVAAAWISPPPTAPGGAPPVGKRGDDGIRDYTAMQIRESAASFASLAPLPGEAPASLTELGFQLNGRVAVYRGDVLLGAVGDFVCDWEVGRLRAFLAAHGPSSAGSATASSEDASASWHAAVNATSGSDTKRSGSAATPMLRACSAGPLVAPPADSAGRTASHSFELVGWRIVDALTTVVDVRDLGALAPVSTMAFALYVGSLPASPPLRACSTSLALLGEAQVCELFAQSLLSGARYTRYRYDCLAEKTLSLDVTDSHRRYVRVEAAGVSAALVPISNGDAAGGRAAVVAGGKWNAPGVQVSGGGVVSFAVYTLPYSHWTAEVAGSVAAASVLGTFEIKNPIGGSGPSVYLTFYQSRDDFEFVTRTSSAPDFICMTDARVFD